MTADQDELNGVKARHPKIPWAGIAGFRNRLAHGYVVGADIEVLTIDYDGDDRRGLIAHVERDGEKHIVSLLEVTARGLPADTARLLAAYRRWSGADARKGEL